ncbi:MAG: hypothetical protein ACREHC_08260 [Candidatus Levyibacteriota bacterium]
MAKKVKVKVKTKQEKIVEKVEKERSILERLGFVQLMFDFYTSPLT